MNSSIMNDFDDYMLSRNIKFLVTVMSYLFLFTKLYLQNYLDYFCYLLFIFTEKNIKDNIFIDGLLILQNIHDIHFHKKKFFFV